LTPGSRFKDVPIYLGFFISRIGAAPFSKILFRKCQFSLVDCAFEGARGIKRGRKRNFMKTISPITLSLSAGIFVAAFASNAFAGCGDLASLQGPFTFAQPDALSRPAAPPANGLRANYLGSSGSAPSMVGLWKFQFISQGNTAHNPSIPDGALLDFGFTQWHSDGTEIMNSGGHSPASENFCLGVWGQTGFLTFELNHFPISYDAANGTIANYINIREQDTLSPSGDSYTGTFTLDVYDTMGNQVDHLVGNVVGTRITLDSTFPGALPTK
jgi:hypothetical protein